MKKPLQAVRLLLVLLLVFPGPGPLADEVTTLTPVADSWLGQAAPTVNNGAVTPFEVTSESGKNARAVLHFNLAGPIPAGSAVKTSRLSLFMTSNEGSRSHAAHRLIGDPMWTEAGVTWNSRDGATNWTTAGGDFFGTAADTITTGTVNNVTLTWNIRTDGTVTNIPQGWLDGTVSNRGLLIKDTVENNAARRRIRYSSKEEPVAAERPVLEVHYLRDVTLAAATPGISEVTWSWTFPTASTAANYDGVLFAKKLGTGAAFVFAPADGTAHTVGQDLGSGESVAINTTAFATLSAVDENGADSVVLPTTAYTYKAFTHDATTITGAATPALPHYAFGVSGNVTTLTGGVALKNWSYKTGAATLAPPGLLPGSTVVTGSNDNKVHSMNSADGGRRYRPVAPTGTTGGAIQARPPLIPAAFSSTGVDVVYVGAGDGKVYAFNVLTGAKLWESVVLTSGLGSSLQGAPAVQVKAFSNVSYPHLFDLVVVGTRNTGGGSDINNSVVALNGNTGAVVWTFAPGNLDIISSTPQVDFTANAVWVSSRAGTLGTQPSLWKLDTTTLLAGGSLLASVVLTGLTNKNVDGSPTLNDTNSFIYALTQGGDLVAVNATTSVFCSTNVGGAGVGFPLPVTSGGNDDLYFSTTGGVHKRIFNRNCSAPSFTLGWNNAGITSPSTPIFSPPPLLLAIYVGAGGGLSNAQLHKLNPADGAILLTRTVNATVGSVAGDPSFDVTSLKLYVGDTSGRIYSFDQF